MSDKSGETKKGRRSSFFNPRKSFCVIDIAESSDPVSSKENGDSTEQSGTKRILQLSCSEEELIKTYVARLKQEERAWKDLDRAGNLQYKETVLRVKAVPTILHMAMCAPYLSEEDRNFLAERPDYVKLGLKLDETLKKVAICKRTQEMAEHVAVELKGKASSKIVAQKRGIISAAYKDDGVPKPIKMAEQDGDIPMDPFLPDDSFDVYD